MTRCACGCGQRAVARHHVCYEQHVRAHGGNVRDSRNTVPLAFACHGAQHSGSRRLLLSMLPDSAFEFCGELLGEGAVDYLMRYYLDDGDPRLERLP